MGNTGSSSGKHSHSHNIRDEIVDFGYLSPQGIYTGPQDWNQELVGKLIVDRKLAPFYRPLEDYEPDWDDDTILRNRKLKPGEESLPPSVTLPVSGPSFLGKGSAKGKGVADRREQQRMSEAEVYRGAIECPICFMYYPPNINRSRCCDQAICTECFVQIKRAEPTTTHIVSEPAACPYCVQENFGVTYEPPSWRAGLVLSSSGSPSRPELPRLGGSAISTASGESQGHLTAERSRRKSIPHQSVEVVTIDYIRPDWEAKLEAVRATVARRANRRIVMRQVGDRLIPVGITSGRVVPVNIGEGDTGGSGRRGRRQRPATSGELPMPDLEELMMMEAMRLSLLEHEAQQRREREAEARGADSSSRTASSREIANSSPDPASGLQQQDHEEHQPSHTNSSLSVTSAGLAASLDPSTLQPNSSHSEPTADRQSSTVSPRESLDPSQAGPSSHRRSGSGPLQAAPSPLGGAATLAMAVGFPSASDLSGEVTEESGFPSRTLNTLSAAVSASSIPAVILGPSPDDRPEHEPGTSKSEVGELPVDHSSLGESHSGNSPLAHQEQVTTIASSGSVPNPHSALPLTMVPSNSTNHNPSKSSAAFLSTDARTATETSVRTTDTQQSIGDNYNVLPSSPETETEQPLISEPSNLARPDTGDSYHALGGPSTA
ncbi:c2h2 zinc finger protein, partial [Rhizoctonia solani]